MWRNMRNYQDYNENRFLHFQPFFTIIGILSILKAHSKAKIVCRGPMMCCAITEKITNISIFLKTETDTDFGMPKTEKYRKYRKPTMKTRKILFFGFLNYWKNCSALSPQHMFKNWYRLCLSQHLADGK